MFDDSMTQSLDTDDSTSRSLIERVQQRDPEAWRRFAALYTPIVYRWIKRQGLRDHDAADVAQEVFQAVVQSIERFARREPGDSLRGWLWTITRSKVCDHFRRQQSRPAAEGGSSARQQFNELPQMPDASDESPAGLTSELAHRALQFIETEFEPTTWQAFWAAAVEGQPAADIARELGLTIGAVYKAKSRVLLRLRTELDGLLD